VVAALVRREPAARMGAWLERVGRNARIDRWRVEQRRAELKREIEPPMAPPDPEEGVLARERRSAIRRALATLPRPLRRAALARFHADLPFEAVAARLGTREVTARTRVHRALERLRAQVGGLRAMFAPWPGAQATVLGLTLVATVARPALFPAAEPVRAAETHVAAPAARPWLEAQVIPAAPAAVPPLARPARPLRAATPAAPPPVQRMSFDEDVVEVGLLRPDGESVVGDTRTTHVSLIELRWSFVAELAKTLEDL
jgi:RNA polymerase sigma factor (sigma-70 family)